MKAKELLNILQQLPPEHLDLEVYGYCDHGQSPEKVSAPSIIYIEKDVHTIYDYEYSMDKQDAEENGWTHKAILL